MSQKRTSASAGGSMKKPKLYRPKYLKQESTKSGVNAKEGRIPHLLNLNLHLNPCRLRSRSPSRSRIPLSPPQRSLPLSLLKSQIHQQLVDVLLQDRGFEITPVPTRRHGHRFHRAHQDFAESFEIHLNYIFHGSS